jgi:hypothetical protein
LHKSGWRSVKHKAQSVSSLERYVFPHIGNVSVADIDFGHVISLLGQTVDGGNWVAYNRLWNEL